MNVLARAELQKLPLREAIRASDALVQSVRKGLAASGEVAQLGLEILGLNILAINRRRKPRERWRLKRVNNC